MWIFTSNAFVSIVAHRSYPGHLLVRARKKEHLQAFLVSGQEAIQENPRADYRWRITVHRDRVKAILESQIQTLGYDNFKNSIKDSEYHSACHRVWADMLPLQEGAEDMWDLFSYTADATPETTIDGGLLIMGIPWPVVEEEIRDRHIQNQYKPEGFDGAYLAVLRLKDYLEDHGTLPPALDPDTLADLITLEEFVIENLTYDPGTGEAFWLN